MVSIGELLGLGQGLALLTYVSGALVMALPIPWKETKSWASTLMKDAVISEFALLSVSVVQLIVSWTSQMFLVSIGSPFNSDPIAITTILAQLVSLDSAILLLISGLSATVVLAPVAGALGSMLGSMLNVVTTAIVAWTIIQLVISVLPQVWLSIYVIGVVFLSVPFRIGRRFGTLLMASSIVLAVGLPLMPSLAIWLQGQVGYATALGPLQSILSQIRSNPLLIAQFLATVPQAIGGLLAAVIISLVLFPFSYLFILGVITRSLSNLLGGVSSGPVLSEYITTSSQEIGSTIVRGGSQ